MCHHRVFVILVSLDVVIGSSTFEPTWNYDNETSWPGVACIEGGTRQSPIDIRTANVVQDYGQRFIKSGPLKLRGYQHVLVSGINNGHTVQFSTEGEEAIHPTIMGGPLAFRYRLEQLHFHWLSEHSVNGNKFPMEIHFVHVRSDLSVDNALQALDGLAILSVFCHVKAELTTQQKQATEEIIQHMPRLMKTSNRVSGVILNMTKLLPRHLESYYTYAGSLTSPECNEAVIWIIFEDPVYMTDAHYKLFGKVGERRHNFRNLQKVDQHVVFAPVKSYLRTPQIVRFFDDTFRTVGDFFRNLTSYLMHGFKP